MTDSGLDMAKKFAEGWGDGAIRSEPTKNDLWSAPATAAPSEERRDVSMTFRAEGEREAERATFDKACKALCEWCDKEIPMGDVRGLRLHLYRGGRPCAAAAIRAAFPHLAEGQKSDVADCGRGDKK